jgi:hypothetical protein
MGILTFPTKPAPTRCPECGSLECGPVRCRFAEPDPRVAAARCPYIRGRTCDCGQTGKCLEAA